MLRNKNIAVFGDCNIDILCSNNLSFAFADLVSNGTIEWGDLDIRVGGSAANFAYYAKQSGLNPVLFGSVGNDLMGEYLVNWLREKQIDYRIKKVDINTGLAVIVRDLNDIRFLLNNQLNSNSVLGIDSYTDDINACSTIYVSGYCIMKPSSERAKTVVELMRNNTLKYKILDIVPHRIYNIYTSFEEFYQITKDFNLIISETSTMRRFLKLGNKTENVELEQTLETLEVLKDYYESIILRYGPSGCDYQTVYNKSDKTVNTIQTGHSRTKEKVGFGDLLTLETCKESLKLWG